MNRRTFFLSEPQVTATVRDEVPHFYIPVNWHSPAHSLHSGGTRESFLQGGLQADVCEPLNRTSVQSLHFPGTLFPDDCLARKSTDNPIHCVPWLNKSPRSNHYCGSNRFLEEQNGLSLMRLNSVTLPNPR